MAFLHRLKRHPFAVETRFAESLVLTYALPSKTLKPMLPPGLALDTYGDLGFVAIAVVDSRALRPTGWPRFFGVDFLLSGYRIFVRRRDDDGSVKRGLHILQSITNKRLMAIGGNVFTHYRYEKADMRIARDGNSLAVQIATRGGQADLDVVADLSSHTLPDGSPFEGTDDARRFVGPLPWTLDYERETNSIIAVRGHRQVWKPQQVAVDVRKVNYFDAPQFDRTKAVLANAFHVSDIPYRWDRGVVIPAAAVDDSWTQGDAVEE